MTASLWVSGILVKVPPLLFPLWFSWERVESRMNDPDYPRAICVERAMLFGVTGCLEILNVFAFFIVCVDGNACRRVHHDYVVI